MKVNSPKTGPKVKPKLDGSGNIDGEAETYWLKGPTIGTHMAAKEIEITREL